MLLTRRGAILLYDSYILKAVFLLVMEYFCIGTSAHIVCTLKELLESFLFILAVKIPSRLKKIKLSKETFSAEKERLMNYYDILTPFLWCSPHKCPTVGVPDKVAKVLTSLPTSPLLLQGGHDEVLC